MFKNKVSAVWPGRHRESLRERTGKPAREATEIVSLEDGESIIRADPVVRVFWDSVCERCHSFSCVDF
jgi:hypothetical protein